MAEVRGVRAADGGIHERITRKKLVHLVEHQVHVFVASRHQLVELGFERATFVLVARGVDPMGAVGGASLVVLRVGMWTDADTRAHTRIC